MYIIHMHVYILISLIKTFQVLILYYHEFLDITNTLFMGSPDVYSIRLVTDVAENERHRP